MKLLKYLRKQKGLLQKDVAEKIGVGRTTYVKYENGDSEPDFETLSRIADFFDVSVDYLLGRDTESKQKEEPAIENDDRLDAELIKMLCQLHPDEAGRVRDFVSGLIAARKE